MVSGFVQCQSFRTLSRILALKVKYVASSGDRMNESSIPMLMGELIIMARQVSILYSVVLLFSDSRTAFHFCIGVLISAV
jgi:hypothetical protein